jgi:hypothetical protein
MEVKTCLRDVRYVLVEFQAKRNGYVFLYDADQHSLFLGQETQTIDLVAFWQKHRLDKAYCLPCELMLCFEKRWMFAPDYPPVELGMDTSTAGVLIESLKGRIPFLKCITFQVGKAHDS